MADEIQLGVGRWWRFTKYVAGTKHLGPAPGATLVRYEPWKKYWDARQNGHQGEQPPYLALIRALQDYNQHHAVAVVEDWCVRNGLLGLLLQRVQAVTLAPRRRGKDIFQVEYVRAGNGWECWRYQGSQHTKEAVGACQRAKTVEDANVIDGAVAEIAKDTVPCATPLPRFCRPVGTLVTELADSRTTLAAVESVWPNYFPPMNDDQAAGLWYPFPDSDRFARGYAEPLDEFLEAADLFAQIEQGYRMAGEPNNPAHASEPLDEQAIRRVRFSLRTLLTRATPALVRQGQGERGITLTTPSLLGDFAAMHAQDLAFRKHRVCACRVCGLPFLPHSRSGQYCQEKCKNTAKKRRYRQRYPGETTKPVTSVG